MSKRQHITPSHAAYPADEADAGAATGATGAAGAAGADAGAATGADAAPVQDPGRSRRALIRAGLAGAAGLALGALATPDVADAAAGGNMLIGRANAAGTAGTSLSTKSTAAALTVAQAGTGPGVRASSVTGQAGAFSASKGHGLTATTGTADRQAVRATSNASPVPGVAVRGLAGGAVDATITSLGLMAAAGEFASPAIGVVGTGGDKGVAGVSTSGNGVYGKTDSGSGVYAEASSGTAVFAASSTGDGVFGYSNSGIAVQAASGSGDAVSASTSTGRALYAETGSDTNPVAVLKNGNTGTGGAAGIGIQVLAGGKTADDIRAVGLWNAAGEFASSGTGIVAVGYNAVYGVTELGTAVTGSALGSATGVIAASSSGVALIASAITGKAVEAESNTAAIPTVTAQNNVIAHGADAGVAVRGLAGYGTISQLTSQYGSLVSHAAGEFAGASGVIGVGMDNTGVYGISPGVAGVVGVSTNGFGAGVYGYNGVGGYGVYSNGPAYVTSSLNVQGTLSKGGGSFKIDHPLDPANKYLYHSFVESPDMKNIYDGVVELDAKGAAVVTMPDWFEALNRDVRYQLTAIGRPMPDLHVADELAGGSFSIGGGAAGRKVSWMVTGIRRDAWAEQNRIPVEETKTGDEAGRYLHPGAHGLPESAGIVHAQLERLQQHAPAKP